MDIKEIESIGYGRSCNDDERFDAGWHDVCMVYGQRNE